MITNNLPGIRLLRGTGQALSLPWGRKRNRAGAEFGLPFQPERKCGRNLTAEEGAEIGSGGRRGKRKHFAEAGFTSTRRGPHDDRGRQKVQEAFQKQKVLEFRSMKEKNKENIKSLYRRTPQQRGQWSERHFFCVVSPHPPLSLPIPLVSCFASVFFSPHNPFLQDACLPSRFPE